MTGGTLHPATGVCVCGRAVLLEGPPGSGKSTLALALIDRGAVLIGDDAVVLTVRDGALWAAPPPNIAGKLEVRNIGIVDLPCTEAPIALVLRLCPDAPRFVDEAACEPRAGIALPVLSFDPAIAAAPVRAEWAMRRYGLEG